MTQEGFNGWSALTDDGNFFQLLRLTFIKRKLTQTVQMLKYILTVLLYGLINNCVLEVNLAFHLQNFDIFSERSCNALKECFWEQGNWFFQFRDSSGARIPWRSAEIVRFEIPWSFFTVNINLHFWLLTIKYNLFWRLTVNIRDLTIRQRRRQWKSRWKIDFTFFETFLPLNQVTQSLESREIKLELKRGDHRVRVQREIVKFIALPFPFSSQLKIWSFHVVVVVVTSHTFS